MRSRGVIDNRDLRNERGKRKERKTRRVEEWRKVEQTKGGYNRMNFKERVIDIRGIKKTQSRTGKTVEVNDCRTRRAIAELVEKGKERRAA